MAKAMARLSDETVRKRFPGPKPRLTGPDLRQLTEIDHIDHWAEVAVLRSDPDVIVGVARWIRDPGRQAAGGAAVRREDALRQRRAAAR